MAVILPKNYPFISSLIENNIIVLNEYPNIKQVLNIGILNIMPNAEKYEVNLLNSIGHFDECIIKPHFIKLNQHKYGSTDKKHLESFYTDYKTCTSHTALDGIIITGAPVEHLPYSEINYWNELKEIMDEAWKNNIPQVGLCWAGLAVAELLGIDKFVYDYKLFGIFESNYTNDMFSPKNKVFYCPQSRHAGIADETMEKAAAENKLVLLGYSKEPGYFIFESPDKMLLAHTGHSEYHKQRIVDEYKRDKMRGRDDVKEPSNFDVENPANLWKQHRKDFFQYWLRIVQNNSKDNK